MSEIKLNDEQLRAVQHADGPLLIVAGAGTGKTTVITERIKWLIEKEKAKPSEILALTFTERAAAEMEERVDMALPMGYTQTWIMTFHAFCERVLRQEAVQIGLDPDFRVMSEAETYLFVRDHLFDFDLDYFRPKGNPIKFISGLVTHFSRLKDDDISTQDYQSFVKSKKDKKEAEELRKLSELTSAYKTYETLKVENSVMDFSDLISNTLKVFRQRPNVLAEYQAKFKYLLIDEFQDTNYAQNHLAIMLAGDDKNITAVSDDDQAIYRWRGAAVYNVLDFKKHFPESETVVLTKNYRSQQYILDYAYQLIQNNNPNRLEVAERIDKQLHSQTPPAFHFPHHPQLIFKDRVEDEAETVTKEIQRLLAPHNTSPVTHYQPRDIAILIRANAHAEPFTRTLGRAGIPYQFLGPGQLFNRPEIRNLIAYLKVLSNFEDDEATYRVLNMPAFNFSGRDVAAVVNHARKNNTSLFEALESQNKPGGFRKLVSMIHRHLDQVSRETPGQILYYFLSDVGMLKRMAEPKSEEEVKQVQNIAKFFDKIKAFETAHPEARVHNFVEYLDFLMAAGESPLASEIDWSEENAVNIITVHSAKGLEFPVVFIVNLVNLRFPTMNRRDQIPVPEEIIKEPEIAGDVHEQEERRLFYVGMTRAKERLYFTGAKFYGDTKRAKKLSGFVLEALGEDLEKYFLKSETEDKPTLFDYAGVEVTSPDLASESESGRTFLSKVNYLSYSRISDFQICPLHYKLKHILRIPTPPSGALSYGNAIHNALRDFFKQLTTNNQQSAPSLSILLDLFDKHWSPVGFESKAHEQERYQAGEKTLKVFFEQEDWNEVSTVAIEQPFTIKIAGDLKIGGRIDRVDRLDDGTLEIIDYKTGALKEEKELAKDLQLSIYALAAHHSNVFNQPLDQLKLSFYYFDGNQKMTLEKSAEDLEVAKEEILEVRNEIEKSDFTCSHGYLCQRGCEFSLFCLEQE